MDESTQQKSKLGQLGWIAIIVVLVWLASKYYVPESTSEDIASQNTTPTKTIQMQSETESNDDGECMNANFCDMDDKKINRSSTIPKNLNSCGYSSYGYPDFSGTEKEGRTCADVPDGMRDQECAANPPKNYDGAIMLSATNLPMSCCDEDGTCQWGVKYK